MTMVRQRCHLIPSKDDDDYSIMESDWTRITRGFTQPKRKSHMLPYLMKISIQKIQDIN